VRQRVCLSYCNDDYLYVALSQQGIIFYITRNTQLSMAEKSSVCARYMHLILNLTTSHVLIESACILPSISQYLTDFSGLGQINPGSFLTCWVVLRHTTITSTYEESQKEDKMLIDKPGNFRNRGFRFASIEARSLRKPCP